MRFKNFSQETLVVQLQGWTHLDHEGVHGGIILVSQIIGSGDVTKDFDPEDPAVQVMLKAHPELRPYVTPTVWEHLRLRPI
jgi:hypothetical protein